MIINSLLIGKGKGSAGNITVNQLKGQTILKQKASMVANPRTDAQVAQRDMVSRAVYFWQLFGNVLKSGWTSLLPFCSEYNTFVSTNSGHFKTATFTRESYKNLESIGAQATKGRLGSLDAFLAVASETMLIFAIPAGKIKSIAKVGDTIKILIGVQSQETMSYFEKVLLPADIVDGEFELNINSSIEGYSSPLVYAVWLESADGKDSTTSKFVSN
jgi:hypothetical protein